MEKKRYGCGRAQERNPSEAKREIRGEAVTTIEVSAPLNG